MNIFNIINTYKYNYIVYVDIKYVFIGTISTLVYRAYEVSTFTVAMLKP